MFCIEREREYRMDLIVLSTRFQPDPEKIAAKYAVDSDDPLYSRIKDACQEVGEIGKPVACFKEAKVDEWGSDYVVIDGVRFSGKFIADRLKNSKIVYPYVASCGKELDTWGRNCGDMILDYCYDDIRQSSIKPVLDMVHETVMNRFGAYKLASVNPGSIPQWPLSEQKPLFNLLGSVYETTQVKLEKNLLMYPLKSVSGILFESDEGYCNCRICRRQNCPGRREELDEDQFAKMLDW